MLGALQAERRGSPLVHVDNIQEGEPETGKGKYYENDDDNSM